MTKKHKIKKIVLTGGGTAGHVTPNMALLDELRNRNFEVHYIGRTEGIEKDLIVPLGITYHGINSGKLRRYFDWKNFSDIFRIFQGWIQSIIILIKIKPSILFSKGGFVACPPVWAAWLLRIPIVIHESDMTPGLANKLSIPFAQKVCLTFKESVKHIKNNKSVLTGLPVRDHILQGSKEKGFQLCNFNDNKPVIIVMGGSQGAAAINECIRESLDLLLPEFQICHLCGKGNLAEIAREGYFQLEYAKDELADLFAMTSIIVSRAGATSIFEILALRIPNILIPLPKATSRGDQILNAQSFMESGYSILIAQEDLNVQDLVDSIKKLHSSRSTFIDKMETSELKDAANNVVNLIDEIV